MNNTNDVTQIVIEFREDLHSSFQYRADATMNLIDSAWPERNNELI